MISHAHFQVIADIDLEPIKVKLMHEESGEGWSLEKAEAVEFEYRRFLYLMKAFPTEQTAPLFDVDTFWHYHILDTQKYAIDCEQVFGYFLHHFPYIGLRGEDDAAAHQRVGERMRELYESTFGEPYVSDTYRAALTAFSGAQTKTAFSGAQTAFSGAQTKTAFSGAQTKAAFSGAQAMTAFSGAQSRTAFSGAQTAFSGAQVKTAFSGAQTRAAFSGAQAQAAFSGAQAKPAFSGAQSAFSGAQTAFSGAQAGAATQAAPVSAFYSVRPRLSDAS
jgi:hypothetical protein